MEKGTKGNGGERTTAEAFEIKVGLAVMLKGGVIMDVTDAGQAKIAEDAGACAVMALERVPADIRRDGGVARMSSVEMIEQIQKSVSIPVMAKVRIGHIVEAVRHLRSVNGQIRAVEVLRPDELMAKAKELGAPVDLVRYVHDNGRLPVPNFAAGGVATPADASLCRVLGAEAIFVGSGIFKSDDPSKRARAIVRACTHWDDPAEVLAACRGLGKAMEGLEMETLDESQRLANRGW
jgi:pyridoxal biosynthesis lyase PdxS